MRRKFVVTILITVLIVTCFNCKAAIYQSAVFQTKKDTITINKNRMNITIGEKVLTVTLADNSSAEALKDKLEKGPITIDMSDYGNMEKVGDLGFSLPRNDKQITTEAGDIILYQGSAFVIYYAPNSWNFTKLGKVDDLNTKELKEVLGKGNVKVTLSLP